MARGLRCSTHLREGLRAVWEGGGQEFARVVVKSSLSLARVCGAACDPRDPEREGPGGGPARLGGVDEGAGPPGSHLPCSGSSGRVLAGAQTCGPRVLCALDPGGAPGAVTCFRQKPTDLDECGHVRSERTLPHTGDVEPLFSGLRTLEENRVDSVHAPGTLPLSGARVVPTVWGRFSGLGGSGRGGVWEHGRCHCVPCGSARPVWSGRQTWCHLIVLSVAQRSSGLSEAGDRCLTRLSCHLATVGGGYGVQGVARITLRPCPTLLLVSLLTGFRGACVPSRFAGLFCVSQG